MNEHTPPRVRCATRGLLIATVVAAVGGCQVYEPAPLDLHTYWNDVEGRALHIEPIEAFVSRLATSGHDAPGSFSLADGLDPAEGEVLALFCNAELRLARAEAGVALATLETAGLWEDPVFGFDGAEIISPSSPFEYGLFLELTIPVSGRLEVEKERAGAAYEAALRNVVNAEWMMRARVRRAWAAWVSAREQVHLVDEILAQIERIRNLTDRLEAAGELTRPEARLFRVELADRLAQREEAELVEEQRRIALMHLLGLSPGAPIELVPEMPAAPLPERTPSGSAGDLEQLLESNTELAVRRAEYIVAEETLRLEIREQFPDITIGSGYGSEDDHRVLVGVSIPVPILNANRAAIADALARRDVARLAAEVTLERLASELASAWATIDVIRARRDRYRREIVPMLAEQSKEVEAIARLGEVDALLLLETVTRQLDAKTRLLDLHLAEIDAAISIAALIGPPVTRSPAPVRPAADTTPADNTGRRSPNTAPAPIATNLNANHERLEPVASVAPARQGGDS